MVAANREAEEEKRKHSERICAAIEQQIQLAQQQNIIYVKVKKPKPRWPKLTPAEMLAMVDETEE